MEWFVKAFIKSSVIWLAIGVSLGVVMAVFPTWTVFRPAHLHINVVGFVAMMIFGVAYHVIPRFAGVPLRNRRAAGWHWMLANAGLAAMVVGFALRGLGHVSGSIVLAVGGSLVAIGAYIFAWLIFQSVNGRVPARIAPNPSATAGARVALPTLDAS